MCIIFKEKVVDSTILLESLVKDTIAIRIHSASNAVYTYTLLAGYYDLLGFQLNFGQK